MVSRMIDIDLRLIGTVSDSELGRLLKKGNEEELKRTLGVKEKPVQQEDTYIPYDERVQIVQWLARFCRHINNGDMWLTDADNLEFFKKKMRQQFGWDTDDITLG